MNGNSTWLILIAMVGIALAVFLFSASGPNDTGTAHVSSPATAQAQPVGVENKSVQPAQGSAPLIADAGTNLTLDERESVRLHGEARNVSSGALAYHWSAAGERGHFDNAYQQDPIYTAPSICGCDECIPLTLTVTAASGVSASDQVYVRVRGDPLNCDSSTVSAPCGTPNPCGIRPEPVKVSRCQPERPPCESPCIQHVSPAPVCSRAPVPCCTSPCGWQPGYPLPSQATTLRPADRPSPLITRRYPSSIDEGSAVKLYGTVSNPACASVCFSWKASKGSFEDADTLIPIYHAPLSDRFVGEDVTITLTIHDEYGDEAYDQIRMHIDNLDYRGSPAASTSNNWLMRKP